MQISALVTENYLDLTGIQLSYIHARFQAGALIVIHKCRHTCREAGIQVMNHCR